MNIQPNRSSPAHSSASFSPPPSPEAHAAQRALAAYSPASPTRSPAARRRLIPQGLSEADAAQRQARQQLFEHRLAEWEESVGLVFSVLRELDVDATGGNLILRNRHLAEKIRLPDLFTLMPRLDGLSVQCLSESPLARVSLPRSLIDCPSLKSLSIGPKTKIPSWVGRLQLELLGIHGEHPPMSESFEGLGFLKKLSVGHVDSAFLESLRRADALQSFSLDGSATPPEWLTSCPQLTDVRLHPDRMAQPIPDWIGRLSQLTTLYVFGEFTDLPESLGALANLRSLSLIGGFMGSGMRRLPASIVDLRNLEFLDLRYNPIEELPMGLFQLPLKTLRLSNSGPIRQIPEEIGNCITLTELDLSAMGSKTLLPESLVKLRNLRELRTHFHAGALPKGVFVLPQLTRLTLNPRDIEQLPLQDVRLDDLAGSEKARLLNRCVATTAMLEHSTQDPDFFLLPDHLWAAAEGGEVVLDQHDLPIAMRSRIGNLHRRAILNERREGLEREYALLAEALQAMDLEQARDAVSYPPLPLPSLMTRGVLMQDTALRLRIEERRRELEDAALLA